MSKNPFHLGRMVNNQRQIIDFYEHPIYGDEGYVLCVCHDLKLADESGFYEIDDMTSQDSDEYYPWFDMNGNFKIGEDESN